MKKSILIGLIFQVLSLAANADLYSCKNTDCIYPDVVFLLSPHEDIISLQERNGSPYTYGRKVAGSNIYWGITNGRYSNHIYVSLGKSGFRYHEDSDFDSRGVDQIYEKVNTCQ
jgi:hypothetical protein